MRRARQKRTALVHAASTTPSDQPSLGPTSPALSPLLASGTAALRDSAISSSPAAQTLPTEVLLLPAGTFVSTEANSPTHVERAEKNRQLAIAIRQRIETRLVGRVRELCVRINNNTIVLEGKCSTYYTKQLAQHAALGVLDDEHLENAIVVEVPR